MIWFIFQFDKPYHLLHLLKNKCKSHGVLKTVFQIQIQQYLSFQQSVSFESIQIFILCQFVSNWIREQLQKNVSTLWSDVSPARPVYGLAIHLGITWNPFLADIVQQLGQNQSFSESSIQIWKGMHSASTTLFFIDTVLAKDISFLTLLFYYHL